MTVSGFWVEAGLVSGSTSGQRSVLGRGGKTDSDYDVDGNGTVTTTVPRGGAVPLSRRLEMSSLTLTTLSGK